MGDPCSILKNAETNTHKLEFIRQRIETHTIRDSYPSPQGTKRRQKTKGLYM